MADVTKRDLAALLLLGLGGCTALQAATQQVGAVAATVATDLTSLSNFWGGVKGIGQIALDGLDLVDPAAGAIITAGINLIDPLIAAVPTITDAAALASTTSTILTNGLSVLLAALPHIKAVNNKTA